MKKFLPLCYLAVAALALLLIMAFPVVLAILFDSYWWFFCYAFHFWALSAFAKHI